MSKPSKQIVIPWREISLVLVFLCVTINCFLWGRSVLAQEESTQASQEKEDRIRKEVEAIVRNAQQGSLEEGLEVKRAFCGNLKSHDLEVDTLVIENSKGEKKTITYDDETVFLGISRSKVKADDLELGSFVIAMGYANRLSPESLAAKRVVVQETPMPIVRQSFFGEIDDISEEEKVFVLSPKKGKDVLEVIADEATIKRRENGKVKKAQFSDIAKADRVVLVGEKDKNDNRIKAVLIYIFASSE